MEANGVVLRQPLRFSSSCYSAPSSSSREMKKSFGSVSMGRKRAIGLSGFYDQGHLQYYSCNSGLGMKIISEKITKEKDLKKMKKKQLKLLKGLSKDLSTFSQMGFGLDSDRALVDQIKGNMISEATELLLEQLQKLKAEEKELKRKTKEEKARLKAATKMQNTCEMSSSSSSSETSDSECGEVVDMKSLKRAQSKQNILQQAREIANLPYSTPIIPVIPVITPPQPDNASEPEKKAFLQLNAPISTENECCSKKIEVCMGGKCKKSGAGVLLEQFQRAVGIEGAVLGCKCMGKCRDGPNVKVVSSGFDGVVAANDSVRAPINSLCVGVGLEDVDMIVANLLGESSSNQLGFAAAS